MKSHLFAAGLTVGLHLILGLTFALHHQPEITPWPQVPLTLNLCQWAERGPEEGRAQAPAEPNREEQSPAGGEPQPPETVKVVPPEPLPTPAPQRPARPKKVVGKIKARGEMDLPPALAPQPIARTELGLPRESAAVQERDADVASAASPAKSASATVNNDSIVAPPPAPGDHGLECQPVYKDTPEPQYPVLARRMGYQGTVELKALVNRMGTVEELQLVRSSGYPVLDQSALAAVQQWRFEPGTREATKESMWIKIPVHFSLR